MTPACDAFQGCLYVDLNADPVTGAILTTIMSNSIPHDLLCSGQTVIRSSRYLLILFYVSMAMSESSPFLGISSGTNWISLYTIVVTDHFGKLSHELCSPRIQGNNRRPRVALCTPMRPRK